MTKKRITLRVDNNELAVIGPKELWEHLITVYEFLAQKYPNDKNSWLDAAEWVRSYVQKHQES